MPDGIAESPSRPSPAPVLPSVFKQLQSLLKGHLELGVLEGHYELEQQKRRTTALATAALFGLTAYVFLQVLLVDGLRAAGLPGWAACLVLIVLYAAAAALLVLKGGMRDPRAGRPFQGSRDEWQRSVQWIRRRFF